MGEAGFWDDQEQAAQVSAEHARASRKLGTFRALESDADDLTFSAAADQDGKVGYLLARVRHIAQRRVGRATGVHHGVG